MDSKENASATGTPQVGAEDRQPAPEVEWLDRIKFDWKVFARAEYDRAKFAIGLLERVHHEFVYSDGLCRRIQKAIGAARPDLSENEIKDMVGDYVEERAFCGLYKGMFNLQMPVIYIKSDMALKDDVVQRIPGRGYPRFHIVGTVYFRDGEEICSYDAYVF